MLHRRTPITAVLAAAALAAGIASPASADPNDNASCVAQFGSAYRQAVPGPFGQSVSNSAHEQGGIHGGQYANHHCGEKGNPH